MSYCKQIGKDQVIFVTKQDHETPSTVTLPDDPASERPGLVLENGDINWDCPCLGGMATGPCGPEFREAFSCFHYSKADPKGSDCFEPFRGMQACMSKYPSLYPQDKDEDEEEKNVKETPENFKPSEDTPVLNKNTSSEVQSRSKS